MPNICRKSPIINAAACAEMKLFLLRTSPKKEANKFICAFLHLFYMLFSVYDFTQKHDFFSQLIYKLDEQWEAYIKVNTMMVLIVFCFFHYGFFYALFSELYVPMCLYYAWYTVFASLTMHYVILYNCWLGALIVAHYITLYIYLTHLIAILRHINADNQEVQDI